VNLPHLVGPSDEHCSKHFSLWFQSILQPPLACQDNMLFTEWSDAVVGSAVTEMLVWGASSAVLGSARVEVEARKRERRRGSRSILRFSFV
jgi:hypothetical protein